MLRRSTLTVNTTIVPVQVCNRQSLMLLNLRNWRFSAETLRERHFNDHFDRIFNCGGAIEQCGLDAGGEAIENGLSVGGG